MQKCQDVFTIAGHQCQFGVDSAKPTRLRSNIEAMRAFGKASWPIMSHSGHYQGPLPHWGHVHKGNAIGLTSSATFATSPLAAYPPEMCFFLANCALDYFVARDPGLSVLGILPIPRPL